MKHDPAMIARAEAQDAAALSRPTQHVSPETMERFGATFDDDLDRASGFVWAVAIVFVAVAAVCAVAIAAYFAGVVL